MSVWVVVALRGVGREVNGEGMPMFCSSENDRERAVVDRVSRERLGEDVVEGGLGVEEDGGMGVVDEEGEDILGRGRVAGKFGLACVW
jgi:hypothetical protein